MLTRYDFPNDEFDQAVAAAGRAAFDETLAAGYPVFYLDADDREVKELPDGRRFEIRWIPGSPSGSNYEIVRKLKVRGLRPEVGHGFRLAAELLLGVAGVREISEAVVLAFEAETKGRISRFGPFVSGGAEPKLGGSAEALAPR